MDMYNCVHVIHFDNKSDPATKRVETLLFEHSLQQFINEPTQTKGHTLDWIIGHAHDSLIRSVSVLDKQISDHSLPVV